MMISFDHEAYKEVMNEHKKDEKFIPKYLDTYFTSFKTHFLRYFKKTKDLIICVFSFKQLFLGVVKEWKEMTIYEKLWNGIKSSNIYILLVFDKFSETVVKILEYGFKPFDFILKIMDLAENCR